MGAQQHLEAYGAAWSNLDPVAVAKAMVVGGVVIDKQGKIHRGENEIRDFVASHHQHGKQMEITDLELDRSPFGENCVFAKCNWRVGDESGVGHIHVGPEGVLCEYLYPPQT